MFGAGRLLMCMMIAMALADCTATTDFDRAIGEDISVGRDNSPTSQRPGLAVGHAPIGAMPWHGQSAPPTYSR